MIVMSALEDRFAQQLDLAGYYYERCKNEVKRSAIAYLISEDFEHDMELLGLDEMIKSVRKYVFDDVNKTKSKIKIENEEK